MPLAEFFRDIANKELECNVSGFSSEARKALLTHAWPGNVRELQNRIKRAVLVAETPMLDVDGVNIGIHPDEDVPTASPVLPLKDEALEKESIIRALKACNGRREQAAALLNINPATLYRKIKKYGLK